MRRQGSLLAYLCLYTIACMCYGISSSLDKSVLPFFKEEGGYIKIGESQAHGSQSVTSFYLEVSVDVDEQIGPAYDSAKALTWQGKTELKVQVTWKDPAKHPWEGTTFMLSTQPCNAPDVAADSNVYVASGAAPRYSWNLQEIEDGLPDNVKHNMTLHFYKEDIVDLDAVECALFRVGSTAEVKADIAAPIARPLPDFPSTFYSGIDVSITNKGFTYTVYESYDASCQAVVQEIFLPTLGHTRYLYDYQAQKLWTIRSASNDSAGSCMSQDLNPNNPFVHEDGVQLASAQKFLSFHKDAVYVPRAKLNNPKVSGVPVDTYKVDANVVRPDSNFTGGYGVEYTFAAPSWRNGQVAGHRPLQRVLLYGNHKGPSTNGEIKPVNHTYSFFDFQDSIPDTVTFQPCVMVPGGTGCDCVDLKCAVDESARSKSIELATTHPVHDDVVYDVRNNETTQCSAPKGYVTKGRNSIAVGVAFLVTLLITALLASLVVAAFLRRGGQLAISANVLKKGTKKGRSRRSKRLRPCRGEPPAAVINTSTCHPAVDIFEEQ